MLLVNIKLQKDLFILVYIITAAKIKYFSLS